MRVAIFIDGNNYKYMARDYLGWGFDFNKFLEFCRRFGDIVDATYFVSEDPRDDGFAKFSHAIGCAGISVVNKPPKYQYQQTETSRDSAAPFRPNIVKANMDIEITVGIITSLEIYDMAILVTGDGDFKCVLDLLRSRGKRFKVISCRQMIAAELLLAAGMHYIDAQSLRQDLEFDFTGKQVSVDDFDYITTTDDIESAYPILGESGVQDAS